MLAPDRAAVRSCSTALEFLAVIDSVPTDTAKLAHAVLPDAGAWAKEGTTTSADRRVLRLNQAHAAARRGAAGLAHPRRPGARLAERFNTGEIRINYGSAAEIMDEMAQVVPLFRNSTLQRARLRRAAAHRRPRPEVGEPRRRAGRPRHSNGRRLHADARAAACTRATRPPRSTPGRRPPAPRGLREDAPGRRGGARRRGRRHRRHAQQRRPVERARRASPPPSSRRSSTCPSTTTAAPWRPSSPRRARHHRRSHPRVKAPTVASSWPSIYSMRHTPSARTTSAASRRAGFLASCQSAAVGLLLPWETVIDMMNWQRFLSRTSAGRSRNGGNRLPENKHPHLPRRSPPRMQLRLPERRACHPGGRRSGLVTSTNLTLAARATGRW